MVMNQMRKKTKSGMTFILVFFIAAGLVGFAGIGLYSNVDVGGGPTGPTTGQSPEEQIKSYKEAIAFIEDGLKTEPESFDLNVSLGNSYYDLGMLYEQTEKPDDAKTTWEKAILAYDKAIAKNGQDSNLLVDCATLAFWVSQNDKAENYFKKAMEVDPTHINAKINYGSFLNTLGKKDEAIKYWEEALALKPNPQTEEQIKNNIASVKAGATGGPAGGFGKGQPAQLSGTEDTSSPAAPHGTTVDPNGEAENSGGSLPEGHPPLDSGSSSGSTGQEIQMGVGRPGR